MREVDEWQSDRRARENRAAAVQFARRNYVWLVPVAVFLVSAPSSLNLAWTALAVLICLGVRQRGRVRAANAAAEALTGHDCEDDARTARWIADQWPEIAEEVGLSRPIPDRGIGVEAAAAQVRNAAWNRLDDLAYGRGRQVMVPRVEHVGRCRLGWAIAVELLVGQTVETVRTAGPAVAAAYDVEGVRVAHDRRHVVLTLVTESPLAEVFELTAMTVRAPEDLARVPVGVQETGETWALALDGGSTVIGGEPGAGKSVTINAGLASLALRADVQIVGIDCKGGLELGGWEPRLSALATDQEQALEVLTEIDAIREERQALVRAAGMTSLSRMGYSSDRPLIVVVADETAELFVAESSDKHDKERAVALTRVVSRLVRLGRATGVCSWLATQKPTADSVPTIIRDNCSSKVAKRCTTTEQGVAILGDVLRGSDVTPTSIGRGERGVAVTDTGAGLVRVRSAFVSERARRDIAEATQHLARPLAALHPCTVEGPQ